MAALIYPSSQFIKQRLIFSFNETGEVDISPNFSSLDALGNLVMWSCCNKFCQVEVRPEAPATSFVTKQKNKLPTARLSSIYTAAVYSPEDERGFERVFPLFPSLHIRARQLEFDGKVLSASPWVELLNCGKTDLKSSLVASDTALAGGLTGLPIVLLLTFIWHAWWINGTKNNIKLAWWQAIRDIITSFEWVITERTETRLIELLKLTDYMMRYEFPSNS